jgi:hypothetical protein
MALTRAFRATLGEDLRRDRSFRVAYLDVAIGCLHSGDLATGKAMLRDLINGTVGFGNLGKALRRSPKSLMRMLSAAGNPHADSLFGILSHLQRLEGVEVRVLPVGQARRRRSGAV